MSASGHPTDNLLASAYEGVERLESFPDRAALERYREALLEKSERQGGFLATRLGSGRHVVEVASGNGRLLIWLARAGIAATGLGIDLARSRTEFASEWASTAGLDGLRFETCDVLDRELPTQSLDAALCVTGAFGYLEPLRPGAARAVLDRLHAALRDDGLLCLELYPLAEERRLVGEPGGEARTWRELPESDPWRFYLSRYALDDSGRVLTHEKTFVHRATGAIDAGRTERLRLYEPEELRGLLAAVGFGTVELFGAWDGTPYRDDAEAMVVVARK